MEWRIDGRRGQERRFAIWGASEHKKGRQDMEQVGNALTSIEESIRNLESAVNKVGAASKEIVNIIKLIGDIADETNLLSLNASIEAARAGEAGRGFAVVASEIGTLANNSAESVAHITKLITEINRLVENAVSQAGSSVDEIADSAMLIHTAVDTFNTIYNNINDTNSLMANVVEKIGQVDEVATNVAAIRLFSVSYHRDFDDTLVFEDFLCFVFLCDISDQCQQVFILAVSIYQLVITTNCLADRLEFTFT